MARRRRTWKRYLERAFRMTLWLGVCAALVLLFRAPLRSLYTMARLSTEELHPPLPVPVEGVPPSALSDTWNAVRSGGRRHEGIDIFAPCGHPVISATEGIVLSTGEDFLGGQVVRVFGPAGSRHYYAHLSRFADIGRGDHVRAGDTLAYVGNTGNAAATPCHLHYGIYRGNEAQNPYPYLVQPQERS